MQEISSLPIWRYTAAESLRGILSGANLHSLAAQYGITVYTAFGLNKGWVGQTLERVANLNGGNLRAPDGVGFELKSTSLVRRNEGWKPKEIIKITQVSPQTILEETFETSVLWQKISHLLVVGCFHESPTICRVVKVNPFDIEAPEVIGELRSFWEGIQQMIGLGEIAELTSQGINGKYLQIRPTGNGRNFSTCPVTGTKFPSRAFYANKDLVTKWLDLMQPTPH